MSYQGYANYETWAVSLWLNNEESDYNHWTGRAAELLEENDGDTDGATGDLARELEESIDEANPLADGASLFVDLLTAALHSVDWQEVAESFMEEAAEEYKANHADEDADQDD